jgi:hypothetical protein
MTDNITSSDRFKQARNRWLRAIRKVKRECWESFLQPSDPGAVWKSINAKPQSCAMPPTLISPSEEQYNTLESKMEVIAGISFPSRPRDGRILSQDLQAPEISNRTLETSIQTKFVVCPKMLKRLLRKISNSFASGLDRIGWQELKIWFLLDSTGLCQVVNYLIKTGLPPELKLARVVVISKPGQRDRTSIKSYRCIFLLPTIAKIVEKVITLYLSMQGETQGWWHQGQHRSWAGCNTTDALLWLIQKAHKNCQKKQHMALLMVDVAAAFPNTSRDEVRQTLQNADPGISQWVEQWLNNRQIAMELDGNLCRARDARSGPP